MLIHPALSATTNRIKIDEVPAGFPVRFCLLTHAKQQYVAYFDAQHQMTVASRTINSNDWKYTKLPTKVKWDTHNYITMVVDDSGHLHLAGNMHSSPLMYFITTKPGDATTLTQCKNLIGNKERKCTYPKFMRGPENEFIFHYRSGTSGKGNEIYNVYNHKTKQWSRLLGDKPLTDGGGKMNAYISKPNLGPDGRYHLIWVWRDSPDCSTNHHLSYARSSNLRDWETANGKKVALPLTVHNENLWVDPILPKGGILNGGAKLGFTSKKAPIISYSKYDKDGNNQMYIASFSKGKWQSKQLTNWKYRWNFSGNGSLPSVDVNVSGPVATNQGKIRIAYRHKKYGSGHEEIDESDLKSDSVRSVTHQIQKKPRIMGPRFPNKLRKVTSKFPGMQINVAADSATQQKSDVSYYLRWETLGRNRDKKPSKIPPNSVLEIIEVQ